MRINTSTQWILALLLFFTSNFVTQAQTLDATFSSPLTNQCAGSLFTLNATTTTYQGYTWTIEGPNNFSSTISGSSSALNLTEPGTYNVSLSVTDGVITTNNLMSGYLSVEAPPTVNAGVDQTICANSSVTLNGTIGGTATSISWSGGSGTFSPTNANLSAIYSPSPNEIANGFVNLTITTNDPAGPCSAVTDAVMIIINSVPTVNAGVDQTICANATVTLNATIGGSATSMSWSGGTGTFSPNIGLMSTYSPSPSEIAYGFVNLVITTNDPAGPCSTVSDTIMISFSTPPTANAGVDQTICANSFATLNGSFGGTASSATWVYLSGGTPGTFSNPLILNPTYTPSASDIANGFVNLILRTNDPAGPCSAVDDTVMIIINQVPTIFSAPASICVGSTAQLSPSSGGIWTSSNATRATINAISGLATGVSPGNVTFTLTSNATSCSNSTSTIAVNPLPTVSAPASICEGSTGQLSPSTGGTWISNITAIATVTNSGVVTPVSPGFVTFTYVHTATGCSATSSPVEVYGLPQVSVPSSVCLNSTIQLSPISGGTWVSSNPSIASITNAGLVTGLASGTVNFTFTNSTTGCAGTTNNLTVSPLPTFTLSKTDPTTCNGTNGTITILGLTPNVSYQYSYVLSNISNGPITTTSNSSGQITIFGLSAGSYTLAILHPASGCQSTTQNITLVNPNAPNINDIQDQVLCGTTYSLPAITGTNLPGNQAYYTGPNGTGSVISIGTVISTTSTIYMYTSTIGGCIDEESFTVTIHSQPTVTAPASICVGSTAQLSPSSGGTWVSNSSSIASISSSGLITGIAEGIVSFSFTSTTTGCSTTSSNLTVTANATVNSIPDQIVCAGDSTSPITFSGSAQQYTWTNSNINIGLAPSGIGNIAAFTAINNALNTQIATITVTPISSGCNSIPTTFTITVKPISTVNNPQDQVLCANDSTQIINFSGAALTTNYNWTNDNQSIGLTSSGSGDIPSFLGQNNSTINQTANLSVTPILDGCVGTTQTFTIIVKPIPILNPVLDETVCQNSSTQTIVFSGSNPGTVYNWTQDSPSIGCAGSGISNNIPSFVAQNTTTAPQIATFTVTPSLNGCLGTAINFTISVNPSATVNPIPDQIVCSGELISSITFSGSHPNTTYNWVQDNTSIGAASFGAGNIPSFQAQNPSSGSQIANFIVTPFLEGCTGISDTFSIIVNTLPIINAGNDITLCYGATFTPVATGTAITISWNNGVVQGTSFTPTVTETYIATGTNMNCYTSDSITVTVNSLPQLTISAFDGEDSLACDGTLSVLVTDGTAPYSYTWTNGLNNYTTASIQDLCSGTYSLAVVDANGCSATNSAVINDTLIPTIVGDTLIFTDNIYQDSTIIGADTSAWIENCTFDYDLVTSATIDSYIDSGDSTIVTWIVALSTGSTVSVDATYFMSPGTTGVYDLTLQLYCSAKSGPKFLVASSRLYYEASSIGIQSLSLNSVFLYPNPTKSTLSISGINSDFSYKISDLQGKLLKQGTNEKQIEIENLPAGTYVIGISTDSEVKQLRFVKL